MGKTMTKSFLLELLTEELPSSTQPCGSIFAQELTLQLQPFMMKDCEVRSFWTPRRLAVFINDINSQAVYSRKGPSHQKGLIDGTPTTALLGFAQSVAQEWSTLSIKNDYFYSNETILELDVVLPAAVQKALTKVPLEPISTWLSDTGSEYKFVRRIINIIAMLDDQVLNCEIAGLAANNHCFGLRTLVNNRVNLADAKHYVDTAKMVGVIVDFDTRMECIQKALYAKAAQYGEIVQNIPLLYEVVSLVESPQVVVGEFATELLAIPAQIIISVMAKHQKFFAIMQKPTQSHNSNERAIENNHYKEEVLLTNHFLSIINIHINCENMSQIIAGNERVLAARLADAKFFYDTDTTYDIAYFNAKLANVTYYDGMGSQLDRVMRIAAIAKVLTTCSAQSIQHIVNNITLSSNDLPDVSSTVLSKKHSQFDSMDLVSEIAMMLKFDLATDMVKELPELQGVIGSYYALKFGINTLYAAAIAEHYYPRFSGDRLPNTALGCLLALSDKFEQLFIGFMLQLPVSGSSDRYGLRRAAHGIMAILDNNTCDFKVILSSVSRVFRDRYSHLINGNQLLDKLYQHFIRSCSSCKF
jgi:glycyl-tRNA synthetase beta chain